MMTHVSNSFLQATVSTGWVIKMQTSEQYVTMVCTLWTASKQMKTSEHKKIKVIPSGLALTTHNVLGKCSCLKAGCSGCLQIQPTNFQHISGKHFNEVPVDVYAELK